MVKYIGEKDWMTQAREHKDIFKLTPKQQDLLFYGDILDKRVGKEKGRGDKYLKKIIKGDKKAMFEMYKEAHHTGELPEEAYRNAMTKFLKGNK